ncbi:hypothetical protein [Planococcus halotolerans]|uniref:hypothetical protein n=1 Tax=Planococcus halotolerans TaxID=2233542 RepID=UPI0013677114|nr:hypothetical protein [Planococcus halotolerans]QHJ72060.1 hypothetical protein DNR44_016290 [Planococcus halotolerans]
MKKGKLILLTGLAAAMMVMGAWAPTASQVDHSDAVVASGGVQENSIPTILPPL